MSDLPGPFYANNAAVAGMEETVVGGASSVLGGGKFANGAVTAAFSFVFNHLGDLGCLEEEEAICAPGESGLNSDVQQIMPNGGNPETAALDAIGIDLGEAAADLAPRAPDFVVTRGGDAIPVPGGATGPVPTNSPGFQFNGGAGGNGLAPNVSDVRIMDPNAQNPTGYVNYGSAQSNGGWQSVNPYTGQSIPPSNPWWHIPINTGP